MSDREAWVKRVLHVDVAQGGAGAPAPLAIWRDAKGASDVQLGKLQAALRGLKHPFFARIADEGLGSITKQVQVGMQTALLDLDRAPGDAKAKLKVMEAAGAFRRFLDEDPALPLLENNPFGVTFDMRGILGEALADIETAVGR